MIHVAVRPLEMCYVIVLVEVLDAELLLILKAELAHAMLCSVIHRPLSSPLGYIISVFNISLFEISDLIFVAKGTIY